MPNRILRDWTASDAIDGLTQGAEVFFTRLIMKADDNGCFHGNAKLLKAAMFPLKETSHIEIGAWIRECVDAGIVTFYVVNEKKYLQIKDFRQRLRNINSQFPLPSDSDLRSDDSDLRSDDGHMTARREEKRREVEVEVEVEVEEKGIAVARQTDVMPFGSERFLEVWKNWIDYKKEKKQKLSQKTKELQLRKLGDETEQVAIEMLEQSIRNGWTGIFELKTNSYGSNNKQQLNNNIANGLANIASKYST